MCIKCMKLIAKYFVLADVIYVCVYTYFIYFFGGRRGFTLDLDKYTFH
jgi:hypothetical protein